MALCINRQQRFRRILPKPTSAAETRLQITKPKSRNENRRSYACCECEAEFLRFSNLFAHEKTHTTLAKYAESINFCEYCLSLFADEAQLSQHIEMNHATGSTYLCRHCQKHYKSKRYLLKHLQQAHKQQHLIFYCQICITEKQPIAKEFSTRFALVEHYIEQHVNVLPIESIEHSENDSNEFEMNEEFLDDFLLKTSDDSTFVLSEWETLDLQLPDILLTDNITNGALTAYKCPTCDIDCNNLREFVKHIKLEHAKLSAMLKENKCPYCARTFARTPYLHQHLRVRHSAIKKHVCQLCDRKFATIDHLRKHVMSLHHDERNYSCNICSKNFKQLSHLKQHLKIHSLDKQNACYICTERFGRKIELKRHIQQAHVVLSA